MEQEHIVETVMAVVALLFLAALSALVTKRLRFPYTVGLVVLGVGLAFIAEDFERAGSVLDQFKLEPAMIMFLFIPILIFESAINTDGRLLKRELVPVLALAGPGLLLSTAVIGGLVYLLTDLPLGSALIFGCLISATDPVAVIALFKELGAPRQLTTIVEGESVFNDATAIVTFQIVLTVVTIGIFDTGIVLEGVTEFFAVFFGGLVIGLGFGFILMRLTHVIGDDPLVHITLTLVTAFGAFIVADHLMETSGIMAVLGAGLVVGYYGPVLYSHKVRDYLEIFWEDAAFIANSLIFLMLGLSVHGFVSNVGDDVGGLLVPVLVVVGIALFARAVVVYSIVPIAGVLPGGAPLDHRYKAVMAWSGLRGAVAVALAMSLPPDFPYRPQIINFTFGVTLFTLLVNATTIGWLMARLGLDKPTPVLAYSRAFARASGIHEAEHRVARWHGTDSPGPGEYDRFDETERTVHALEVDADAKLAASRATLGEDSETRRRLLWHRALVIQHQSYLEYFRRGYISWRVLWDLEADLRDRAADPHAVTRPLSIRPASRWRRVLTWLDARLFEPLRGHPSRLSDRVTRDETLRAIGASAHAVLERMAHLMAFSGADPTDLDTCRQHYKDLGRQAVREIEAMEARDPRITETIRGRRLELFAREREVETERYLVLAGALALELSELMELDRPPEERR